MSPALKPACAELRIVSPHTRRSVSLKAMNAHSRHLTLALILALLLLLLATVVARVMS